jgi:hypothetical protein
MTKVVALQKVKGIENYDLNNPNNIYIGRQCNMGGWKLRKSIYYNPFKQASPPVPKGRTSSKQSSFEGSDILWIVKSYYNMVVKKENVPSDVNLDNIRSSLADLNGKTLCCWCKKKSNLKRDIDVLGKKYNNIEDIGCHGDVLQFLIDIGEKRRNELYNGDDINEEDKKHMSYILGNNVSRKS